MLSAPSPATFNSTFNRIFGPDADGTVNGRKVSRSSLKDALVALKDKWDLSGQMKRAPTTPGTDQNASPLDQWQCGCTRADVGLEYRQQLDSYGSSLVAASWYGCTAQLVAVRRAMETTSTISPWKETLRCSSSL
ncbi:hypothetical protein CERSUDRAFT_100921 [Gelatoporia subvermispora B]|uniref:Uncharacterized protein n=1 Tax=Ceriporiopsis subvermispora (strain B) TaxID=914234 RepID=M2Q229_CERS8|nr:hypothetical protein CERSUDRAFT_100921 [Gelatoporia subvermispora B]